MAIPTKDADLVGWSTNCNDRLVASGTTTYKLTAPEVAAYTPLHDAFIAAYDALQLARAAGNRSENLTADKDDAKQALLVYARQLYTFVQADASISDGDKILLGVTVKDVEPTPSPVPATAPTVSVASVQGRNVNVLLRDPANPDRRALPDGVAGAIVMTHLGETAPLNPFDYSLQGPTGRSNITIALPNDVAPGTKVWLSAVWFNGRKEMGPASSPISTYVGDPSMSMAA